jgi:hypothetical protein
MLALTQAGFELLADEREGERSTTLSIYCEEGGAEWIDSGRRPGSSVRYQHRFHLPGADYTQTTEALQRSGFKDIGPS